jgi:hypothetical protein
MTSAADAAIFSKMAGREPGPKSWQRFGRAGGLGWTRKDMGPRQGNYAVVACRGRLLRNMLQVRDAVAAKARQVEAVLRKNRAE